MLWIKISASQKGQKDQSMKCKSNFIGIKVCRVLYTALQLQFNVFSVEANNKHPAIHCPTADPSLEKHKGGPHPAWDASPLQHIAMHILVGYRCQLAQLHAFGRNHKHYTDSTPTRTLIEADIRTTDLQVWDNSTTHSAMGLPQMQPVLIKSA